VTDRQSKVFEPTTIEIRFQHLHKVEEGPQQASLVPVIQRQPSPEDGPGYLRSVFFFSVRCTVLCRCHCVNVSCLRRPRNDVMQGTFTALEGDQFLTFVILFYPPVPMTIFPPLQTTPITSPEPGTRPYHTRFLLFTEFYLVLTFSFTIL
jgi:hypothetical protein